MNDLLLRRDLLLRNGRILDPATGDYTEGDLVAVGGTVVEPDEAPAGIETIDLRGGYVLPGLIDCHVHAVASVADLGQLRTWPRSYFAYRAAANLSAMLDRGFTTIRDLGGADFGIAQAQAEGLIRGPRIAFCGQPLSQTGGHGDDRQPADDHCWTTGMARVVDGVDAVRAAARDELRKGADHLKVMASGGVASPVDRIDSTQYSVAELEAVVEEAEAANRYVAAHAYDVRAVQRALRAGVRSIEHGNLIDEATCRMIIEQDAFLVMNLVTYRALQDDGREHGLPEASWRKVADVLDGGYRVLELASRLGVRLCYGTDLLGAMQARQSEEFAIRGEVQPAIEVIRSATSTAAELLRKVGQVGTLRVGAHADLIVLDDDPLDDVSVLARPEGFRYVIQAARVVRRSVR